MKLSDRLRRHGMPHDSSIAALCMEAAAALDALPPEAATLPEGSAQLTTFHRINAIEDQAEKDGDWRTAFEKMAQRANTLSKILDSSP